MLAHMQTSNVITGDAPECNVAMFDCKTGNVSGKFALPKTP